MPHRSLYLRLHEPFNKDMDVYVTKKFLPETGIICSNKVRACILHLLVNSDDTLHSMQVESIASKTGTSQRVIIYHLEKLMEWGLVTVKKNKKHGSKERRVIWGLNLKHPGWVSECYNVIRNHFFDEDELKELTKRNKNSRKIKKS